jgi:hypothetical protein
MTLKKKKKTHSQEVAHSHKIQRDRCISKAWKQKKNYYSLIAIE